MHQDPKICHVQGIHRLDQRQLDSSENRALDERMVGLHHDAGRREGGKASEREQKQRREAAFSESHGLHYRRKKPTSINICDLGLGLAHRSSQKSSKCGAVCGLLPTEGTHKYHGSKQELSSSDFSQSSKLLLLRVSSETPRANYSSLLEDRKVASKLSGRACSAILGVTCRNETKKSEPMI